MPRLIEQNGKFYRKRRGKLVEIPPQWVGQTTHPQSVRKRRSKLSSGERQQQSHAGQEGYFFSKQYRALNRNGDPASKL